MSTLMINPIWELLLKAVERETSGSVASDRFQYQKNWTIMKAIKLFEKFDSFILFCEFHDDVLFVDHELRPTKVRCIQVKTKSNSHWTVSGLLKRTKSKKEESSELPSIIDKLYMQLQTLGECVEELGLASNALFKLNLNPKGDTLEKETFLLSDLDSKVIEKFHDQAKSLGLACKDYENIEIRFESGEMPLRNHETHIIGVVAEFLKANSINTTPHNFYQLVLSKVRQASHVSFDQSQGVNELINKKGLSRSDIKEVLELCSESQPNPNTIDSLRQNLQSSSAPWLRQQKLIQGARDYQSLLLNPEHYLAHELKDKIATHVSNILEQNENDSISALGFVELCDKLIELLGEIPEQENFNRFLIDGAVFYEAIRFFDKTNAI